MLSIMRRPGWALPATKRGNWFALTMVLVCLAALCLAALCLALDCYNSLYGFKAARRAARAADSAAQPGSRCRSRPLASDAGRLARKTTTRSENQGSRPDRDGFDKGTFAAALIGQTRAG